MKAIESPKEFGELLDREVPIMLDFYADWCGPCKALLPTVERLSTEYDGKVEIRKVNVDQQSELANHFKVRSIPALFFIKGDQVVDQHIGMAPEGELRKKLDKLVN